MFATGPRRRKGLGFVCVFGHNGYRHLPKLREALKRELKIETAKKNTSRKNVA